MPGQPRSKKPRNPMNPVVPDRKSYIRSSRQLAPAEIKAALARDAEGGRIPYSPEIAGKICCMVAIGMVISNICEQPGMPSVRTVHNWLGLHDDFARAYGDAMRARHEYYQAELLACGPNLITSAQVVDKKTGRTMIDPGAVAAMRLTSDNLRWLLAKLEPRKYGDMAQVRLQGHDGGPLTIPRTINLENFSDEQLAQLQGLIEQSALPVVENAADDAGEDAQAGEVRA